MPKLRVLVVEDEATIGLDLQRTLNKAGYDVVGPFLTLGAALLAAEQNNFDVAILDANLNGENSGPLAAMLTERHVPFVVVSGYTREFLPFQLSHAPLIAKPFEPKKLVKSLARVCAVIVAEPGIVAAEPVS